MQYWMLRVRLSAFWAIYIYDMSYIGEKVEVFGSLTATMNCYTDLFGQHTADTFDSL